VLKSLSKTSSKDLAKDLRQAAAVLVDEDSTAWLESDLVPRVLAILRSLPSGRPPTEAVAVCTAAMTVLNNLFTGLHFSAQGLRRFRQLLKADQAACAALVHWGMARPEASEKLPPGRRQWRYHTSVMPDSATGEPEHSFWTPFTYCCSFLVAVDTLDFDACSSNIRSPYNPQLADFNVQEAASPAVMERLLRVVIQHPCGEFLHAAAGLPVRHAVRIFGCPCFLYNYA
jgi:hypothetical protein